MQNKPATPSRILICGSLAYDNILTLEGAFQDHILPDKLHMLNVSFKASHMRREFGGCAGNIAYNLKMLGEEGIPLATVGRDFNAYEKHFENLGINMEGLSLKASELTAQAFIATDPQDNQITIFHPGAMEAAVDFGINVIDTGTIDFALISPNEPKAMLRHAQELSVTRIPVMLDPGQALPLFTSDELKHLISRVSYLIVNAYEWQLIQKITGYTRENLLDHLKALIVTDGAAGSTIYAGRDETVRLPAAKTASIVDPTGCGDAYRAGLIHGWLRYGSWLIAGRCASVMGAIKIASPGGQNHKCTLERFVQTYWESFGEDLELVE